jgi:hypothetical protein
VKIFHKYILPNRKKDIQQTLNTDLSDQLEIHENAEHWQCVNGNADGHRNWVDAEEKQQNRNGFATEIEQLTEGIQSNQPIASGVQISDLFFFIYGN